MDAKPAGQRANALDCFRAALAHYVRCAEFTRECDAIGMSAEDDDLLCTQAPRGDHATQTDRAISDNRHGFSGTDLRAHGRMMAGAHHI